MQKHGRRADLDSFVSPSRHAIPGRQDAGRHYAGPTWEVSDGSAIVGQVAGTSPGSVAMDIPSAETHRDVERGNGVLGAATTVQRINTAVGSTGACYKPGTDESVPDMRADAVFLKQD